MRQAGRRVGGGGQEEKTCDGGMERSEGGGLSKREMGD